MAKVVTVTYNIEVTAAIELTDAQSEKDLALLVADPSTQLAAVKSEVEDGSFEITSVKVDVDENAGESAEGE